MKSLSDAVQTYLDLRRALGFELKGDALLLRGFVSYAEAHGATIITTELAVRWAQSSGSSNPAWHALRLGVVRRLAQHHQAIDPATEVPSADLLPCRAHRSTPYLYSEDEISALLDHARKLPHEMTAATYATLIGLLAITGMRVGEALALNRDDVEDRRELLTVREGKFKKSREVLLHATTLAALAKYAATRDSIHAQPRSRRFFVSLSGTPLLHSNIQRMFARLLQRADIRTPSGRRPRLHDLRHSFAVRTLRNWYRAGVDVEARLPSLSTYLGHVNPSATYWYLSSSPELLSLAGDRAERAWGVLP